MEDTKILDQIEDGLNHAAELLTQDEFDSLLSSLSTGEADTDKIETQSSHNTLYEDDKTVLSQSEVDQLIKLIHKINQSTNQINPDRYEEGYKQGFIDGVKHGMDICEGNISK